MGIRKNRHMIYLGDRVRAALVDRGKQPLSTVLNSVADRYLGMIERVRYSEHSAVPLMTFHAQLYVNVLRDRSAGVLSNGAPLTAQQIATFPAMVEDWLKRNPTFPQEPGKTALNIVKNCDYPTLVALVDEMERLA